MGYVSDYIFGTDPIIYLKLQLNSEMPQTLYIDVS